VADALRGRLNPSKARIIGVGVPAEMGVRVLKTVSLEMSGEEKAA
jgi:hypothetical protein